MNSTFKKIIYGVLIVFLVYLVLKLIILIVEGLFSLAVYLTASGAIFIIILGYLLYRYRHKIFNSSERNTTTTYPRNKRRIIIDEPKEDTSKDYEFMICPNCSSENRVHKDKLHLAVCGSCKEPLRKTPEPKKHNEKAHEMREQFGEKSEAQKKQVHKVILTCPHCGQQNSVRRDKVEAAICGSCKRGLTEKAKEPVQEEERIFMESTFQISGADLQQIKDRLNDIVLHKINTEQSYYAAAVNLKDLFEPISSYFEKFIDSGERPDINQYWFFLATFSSEILINFAVSYYNFIENRNKESNGSTYKLSEYQLISDTLLTSALVYPDLVQKKELLAQCEGLYHLALSRQGIFSQKSLKQFLLEYNPTLENNLRSLYTAIKKGEVPNDLNFPNSHMNRIKFGELSLDTNYNARKWGQLYQEWLKDYVDGFYNAHYDIAKYLGPYWYPSAYRCEECAGELFKTVFPVGREFMAKMRNETWAIKRAFTCHSCNIIYAPKPGYRYTEDKAICKFFNRDEYLHAIRTMGSESTTTGRNDI
jgi:transcription elongation factor Elf1